ncbi:MAG: arginine--tRNA ligase [Bacteroidia bacterium]|nr:arginine--tRNA ligase [Bacteroidia bacterium]MDW8301197.1 arginine--tRNA ligase [Bacteroidia bacterium]
MKYLTQEIKKALAEIYGISECNVEIQHTRKEFEGQYTLLCFPLAKYISKPPEEIAQSIGQYLRQNSPYLEKFNVVKGFLNLSLSDKYWKEVVFKEIQENENFGKNEKGKGKRVLVEFCSPNTNKPLHLGHLRNLVLGDSVANILKFCGYEVIKTNLYNDRGAHICKSMLAWQQFGQGKTPQSTNTKGDYFVVQYYVMAENILKSQTQELLEQWRSENWISTPPEVQAAYKELTQKLSQLEQKNPKDPKRIAQIQEEIYELAQTQTDWFKAVQDMLSKWEAGDEQVIHLWKQMNSWVYEGFERTYQKLNITFDRYDYESQTYLIGKELIKEGLLKGIFYQKPDNSVWIDLTAEKLDHKLVLRSNGTAVYITQDMGTAVQRHETLNLYQSIYVVASEQDYHFKVLFAILKKLGYEWASRLHHLSYGMVYLPTGRMKTREGNVVDIDDLVEEMYHVAQKTTQELGKVEGLTQEELENLYHELALSAIKYYLLKVDPQKDMIFNPEESIDFHGNTGTYLQYTYARIQGIFRKAQEKKLMHLLDAPTNKYVTLHPTERNLIVHLYRFEEVILQAAQQYSPALIANYVYELCRLYGQFHHEVVILHDENPDAVAFRVQLNQVCGRIIYHCLKLLGMQPLERM